jgi:hypothetical protein
VPDFRQLVVLPLQCFQDHELGHVWHLGHLIVNSAELVIGHFDQSCQQVDTPFEVFANLRSAFVA